MMPQCQALVREGMWSMAFFYRCAANLGARPRFIEVRIMTEHTYTWR